MSKRKPHNRIIREGAEVARKAKFERDFAAMSRPVKQSAMSKIIAMIYVNPCEYHAPDGRIMKREYGTTPNGNCIEGAWVLRGKDGSWIDFDQYRYDLASRNNLDI